MKLLRISFFVLLLSLLTKVLGLLREYTFILNFGSSKDMDAFVIASLIPIVVFSSLSSSFSMASVKLISDRYNDSKKNSKYIFVLREIFKQSLRISTFIFFIVILTYYILYFFTDLIDSSTFLLFIILSPTIILFTLTGVLRGYLQVQNRFYISNLIGLPYNMTIILIVFLIQPKLGIYSAAIGSTLGVLGQLLLVYLYFKFTEGSYQKIEKKPAKSITQMSLLLVVFPISLGGLVLPLNFVVDRSLASLLETGTASIINYAGNFLTIPFSLLLASIFSVFFPLLNKLILRKKILLCL